MLTGRGQALPMDEPPLPDTVSEARALATAVRVEAAALSGEAAALAEACARALEAGAAREVLMVHVVPLVVAGLELLGRAAPAGAAGRAWERGLSGARYDLETITPGPVKPDVGVSALTARSRRGPGSDTRG